jgi:hypothetical protein
VALSLFAGAAHAETLNDQEGRATMKSHAPMPKLSRPAAIFTMALALVALLLALPAVAQQTSPTQPPAAADLTKEKLRLFAKASLKVEQLNQKWGPRISGADNLEENRQLRHEAMTEMVRVVQNEGLNVADYNQILQAAQSDSKIAKRVDRYRRETQ